MKLQISFTYEHLGEEVNKPIGFHEDDKLFLSNIVDIKYVDFFQSILPEFSKIVYFEYERSVCPNCGADMDDNGSRKAKPNKLKGIRKEQYLCPYCVKPK